MSETTDAAPPRLPEYLRKTYTWAYLRPGSLRLLDNSLVVSAILWGNCRRLMRAAFDELRPGQIVLQAACVYGDFSVELARRVGRQGRLDVIDVAPLQVENCRRKLADLPQARVRLADASNPGGGPYEAVCCFFLLHEMPDSNKSAGVDGLLACVEPGGRVVFVDYHRPGRSHPLRAVMSLVFRWLEPFAAGLLETEIVALAAAADDFTWRKETFFGGLYQKVVAERKAAP